MSVPTSNVGTFTQLSPFGERACPSATDLTPVPDLDNIDGDALVRDPADHAIIADAVGLTPPPPALRPAPPAAA